MPSIRKWSWRAVIGDTAAGSHDESYAAGFLRRRSVRVSQWAQKKACVSSTQAFDFIIDGP